MDAFRHLPDVHDGQSNMRHMRLPVSTSGQVGGWGVPLIDQGLVGLPGLMVRIGPRHLCVRLDDDQTMCVMVLYAEWDF